MLLKCCLIEDVVNINVCYVVFDDLDFFFVFGNQENIADLQDKLRSVEDKLTAAETCKTKLDEEVLALRQDCVKLSSDLEVSH